MSEYTRMVERRAAGDFEIDQAELRPFVEGWLIRHGLSLLDGELVEAFWAPFADGADEGWTFDGVDAELERIRAEVRS